MINHEIRIRPRHRLRLLAILECRVPRPIVVFEAMRRRAEEVRRGILADGGPRGDSPAILDRKSLSEPMGVIHLGV